MDLKSIDVQGWLDWFAANKDAFDAIEVILGFFVILLIAPISWGIKRFLKWMRSPAPMPNPDSGVHDAPSNNREVRVGGNNPGIINAGEGTVITAGDNATIVVGYTIEKHEAILKSREAQLRADLTRASTAEKQMIQLELSIVRERLVDLKTSYDEAVQENARLKSELAAFAEYIPDDEIIRAQDALEIGDKSTADAILTAAEERSQNIVRASARMAYLRGEIAEGEIRWQDALDHYKRAYEYDNDNPQYADAYATIAWRIGRYPEAAQIFETALQQVKNAGQEGTEDHAKALNNLALLYSDQVDFARAKPLYEQALSIHRRVLGNDHPYTASSLNNLANLYSDQGDIARAEPLYEAALSIRRRVLGDDHPDTAQSLNNLATIYYEQGDFARAEPIYEGALSIRRRVLGNDHPDTANSLNNLATLYSDQGDFARAEPMFEEALSIRRRVLGDDHPDTAQSLNNLASLYSVQGAFARAEPMYEEALSIYRRVLGNDHLDTAMSLNNLANLYRDQDRYADAEPLYTDAVEIMERVLGTEHPNAKLVRGNYEKLLAKMKEQGAAGAK